MERGEGRVKPSPRLKRVIEAADYQTKVIPVLYGYLEGGKLPDPFRVNVRGGTGDRAPDGWFHPSTHPMMTERQLYLYLTDPNSWEPEPFSYTIKMSALVGSMVHDVVETALTDLDYLIAPKGVCPACGLKQPDECHEHGAVDEKTGSRGHMDGVLRWGEGFEFKTAIPWALKNLTNNDIKAFREKWPYYYAQVQEYMRMTGLMSYIVVVWAMGNPWDMREFRIEADPFYQAQIEGKYLSVRRAIELGEMPMPCCAPSSAQSKSCPARRCPVKKMR